MAHSNKSPDGGKATNRQAAEIGFLLGSGSNKDSRKKAETHD